MPYVAVGAIIETDSVEMRQINIFFAATQNTEIAFFSKLNFCDPELPIVKKNNCCNDNNTFILIVIFNRLQV